MNRHAIRILISLVAVGALIWASEGMGYSGYSGTCEGCHGSFVDRGALHDTHTAITSNCGLCHPSNPGSTPVSTSLSSGGFSCLGCHGRDYGGSIGMQAAGLRAHHAAHAVSCSGCHPSDPTPFPESTLPPHYPGAGLLSCSDNLDNDGDDLYDSADLDCSVPVEDTTWGKIKALYK